MDARLALRLTILVVLMVINARAPAQTEYTFAQQGFLTKSGGQPVDSMLSMTFKLYKGGVEVWSETHPSVQVIGGAYEVPLGSLTPFDTVSFNVPIELGIKVGTDAEMNPRLPLRASPRALTLQNLRVRRVQGDLGSTVNLIGGYEDNRDSLGVEAATIAGGGREAFPNVVRADGAFIGGGVANVVQGSNGVISGGVINRAQGDQSAVGGGSSNRATGDYASIGGGQSNESTANYSVVSGGHSNDATALYTSVGGGHFNFATSTGATIAGGEENRAAGQHAFVGGGIENQATGAVSSVVGGQFNAARAGHSMAAGYNAKARHLGSYVWGDFSGTLADSLTTTGDNQFLVRAGGGVGIGTNSPDGRLHVSGPSIGVSAADVERDDVVIEDADAILGLYSDDDGTWASGIVMGELNDLGALVDKWAIVRETSGSGSDLHFRFGTDQDYLNATTQFAITDQGNVFVTGNLDVGGTLSKGMGSFKIDHPLDPENKYLYHSFVESPDMKNVYDGNVVLDETGSATVELPEYFEALNRDFRYQLTCIGGYAPVYVAERISDNAFRIAGGNPGMEVSWMVTGIRKDPYAEMNRIKVEVDKQAGEIGTYLYPDAYLANSKLKLQNAN